MATNQDKWAAFSKMWDDANKQYDKPKKSTAKKTVKKTTKKKSK